MEWFESEDPVAELMLASVEACSQPVPNRNIRPGVREATADDIAVLASIQLAAIEEGWRGTIRDDSLRNLQLEDSRRHWVREFFSDEGGFTVVYEDAADGPVGLAGGVAQPDDGRGDPIGELSNVFVLPSHQHRGIGRELLVEVARRFLESGIRGMKVTCFQGVPAERFYRSLGGTIGGTTKTNIDGSDYSVVHYEWQDLSHLAKS